MTDIEHLRAIARNWNPLDQDCLEAIIADAITARAAELEQDAMNPGLPAHVAERMLSLAAAARGRTQEQS